MFWAREASTATAASMASPRRWTGTESCCHAAARPCQPLSPSTPPPRAASSTAATAAAAAREEGREGAAREAAAACTRTSERSWTIKPGSVPVNKCCSFKTKGSSADCNDSHFAPLYHQTQRGRDCTEESDERSSGTLSSAYPSDSVIGCAQGTVRKAGALAVKNFLVHKKNKKVELATRRKWKHYWVSLKGVWTHS